MQSQSRLNSFHTVKTLFCIALPGQIFCIALLDKFFCIALPGLAVRSKADETFDIVETLICPLQISHLTHY